MKKYLVTLMGCDDYTSFAIELSEEELKFLNMISEVSKHVSEYRCMPILLVKEPTEGDEHYYVVNRDGWRYYET